MQRVGQKFIDRTKHVWRPHGKRRHKCVLCGGISETPGDATTCERYEPLTDEERQMCPFCSS